MFRALLAFAFVLTLAISGFSQTNSEKSSQVPGNTQTPPSSAKLVKDSTLAADSLKAGKAKRKLKAKAKAAAVDSMRAAKKSQDSLQAAAKSPAVDSAKAIPGPVASPIAPASPAPAAVSASVAPVAKDSAGSAGKPGVDSVPVPAVESAESKSVEFKREPRDTRLFNDPQLAGKEYGAGILGSIVAGTLCFYIGSGIETAIEGEEKAHKGTLKFTGIRYDNYKGAFWGGATGMVLGSALTTYFIGQTDEENGGLFLTLLGTVAAGAGAFYVAHLAGVNDDIDWKPFIPLLAIPSLGGTLGFNVSRWFQDRSREQVVGSQSAVWLHAPALAWGRSEGGDRLEVHALNLTF